MFDMIHSLCDCDSIRTCLMQLDLRLVGGLK